MAQIRIVKNELNVGMFWNCIFTHYDKNKLEGYRLCRFLKSKCNLIKHDVLKFIGVYAQVVKLNMSGSNVANTLKKMHEFYKTKSAKSLDVAFEHSWIFLKDLC